LQAAISFTRSGGESYSKFSLCAIIASVFAGHVKSLSSYIQTLSNRNVYPCAFAI
jgi:hypothetical protein